jgi:hypothetical protein
MKPIAFALLVLFLPIAARARDPSVQQQRSSGKKMQWAGFGGLLGGAAIAVLGIASGKENVTTTTYSSTSTNSNCTVTGSAVACASSAVAALVPVPPATGGGTTPLTPPGGGSTITSIPGTATMTSPTATIFTEQRQTANWKIAGPAAGVAGAGALLMYLGHVRVKNAELSVRPNGAVQLAFKW